MSVAIPRGGPAGRRNTLVYEFFDARVLGHMWFIAISDGASVQMLVPTFQSEQAARIFERCVLDYPSSFLLTMDSQLELARRIEHQLASGNQPKEGQVEALFAGLAVEARGS